ncbi:amidohydrolase [Polynucleobacter sp. TSB-Sco08W16]|uniref:amidohydrolase n=1 Tax=Polynucleobacter sp. TSB-Sco08W16 TaxID=1758374 RepID=UPI001BFEC517|nr:amidohydrolase [Polynucleobacter sp. TSB-Sco08W16]QWD74247.1 amidohydrolase [Polynucleobacter sp. TSB-Sco08W16]
MDRRPFIKLGLFSLLSINTKVALAGEYQFNFTQSKQAYLNRIQSIKKSGALPIIDIESSYNPVNFDAEDFVRTMDRMGIAQSCLSLDSPRGGPIWSNESNQLVMKFPAHFIPAGNGGVYPAWTSNPEKFLDENERNVIQQKIPLMGEYEFRHYPSPRQIGGSTNRDVDIPIDSPLGHRLFAFSEETGIPFQLHYEIEDGLLGSLEKMLIQYPSAKVIWCHFAQIRYSARSTIYSPEYVGALLDKHRNLYMDTAFGGPKSIYPISGEPHARYWANQVAWNKLIISRPYRFLAALDLAGDRMGMFEAYTQRLREMLNSLPERVAEIIAYKAAWKLLFNENIT